MKILRILSLLSILFLSSCSSHSPVRDGQIPHQAPPITPVVESTGTVDTSQTPPSGSGKTTDEKTWSGKTISQKTYDALKKIKEDEKKNDIVVSKPPLKVETPATKLCTSNGGQIVIKKNSKDLEYGVCVFDDKKECELWTMFRSQCPKWGVDIRAYKSDEETYCAITGWSLVQATATCTLPSKIGTCSITDYFAKGVWCALSGKVEAPKK